ASVASASSSSPTVTSPPMTAIVAGTAPCERTASSISRATRRLSGRGSPWAMIVLSSATTGRPPASASATSGWTRTGDHPSRRTVSDVWGEDRKLVELLGERGAAGFRSLFDGFPDLVGVLCAIRDDEGRVGDCRLAHC